MTATRWPTLVAGGNVELIDQDVRYGGAVQRAMKGCDSVIHFAAVSINKSQSPTPTSRWTST